MGLIFFCFFEKFFVPILTSGGYVGLSLAVLLAQHHQVTALDIVPEKVEMINNKKSPIRDEYIEKYLAEKELDLTATLNAKEAYSDADFVVSGQADNTLDASVNSGVQHIISTDDVGLDGLHVITHSLMFQHGSSKR